MDKLVSILVGSIVTLIPPLLVLEILVYGSENNLWKSGYKSPSFGDTVCGSIFLIVVAISILHAFYCVGKKLRNK